MRIDKETKQEIDRGFSVGNYILKKLMVVIVIISIVGAACGIGYRYIKTNSDRVIFKNSITYNEGVLDDLAKYKFEYESTDDPVEKKAIATVVRNRFANYDKSKIENEELVKFMEECGI